MNLTQVGKFMPEGLRDVLSMMNMLLEAAAACKVSAKTSAAWNYIGLRLDGLKYWVGMDYADPEKLWFRTRCRIEPEAARNSGSAKCPKKAGFQADTAGAGAPSWIPKRSTFSLVRRSAR